MRQLNSRKKSLPSFKIFNTSNFEKNSFPRGNPIKETTS